jgi:hypothetical protein
MPEIAPVEHRLFIPDFARPNLAAAAHAQFG